MNVFKHSFSQLKKWLPFSSALVTFVGVPLTSFAQTAPIALTATTDLSFGTVTPGAIGGVVQISPAGARTVISGSISLVAGGSVESPAMISLSGSTGFQVDVRMGAATFPLDDPGAGAIMNVTNFDIDGSGPTATITLTTNPVTFPVGARLNVASGQTSGNYVGTYSMIANYL